MAASLAASFLLAPCGIRLGSGGPAATIALPTPRPSATASPTIVLATLTPTPVPSPTAVPPYDVRLRAAESRIDQARLLMGEDRYAEAMSAWDEILQALPEYGEGYLQRAISILNSGLAFSLDDYFEYIDRALADLDASIDLSPNPSGDSYYYRHLAFEMLGRELPYRVDQDAYLELALENLRIANQLGPRTSFSLRKEAFLLFALGRCAEGLARVRELMATADPRDIPAVAGLHSALASGYLCRGDLGRALREIDQTLSMEWSVERRYKRAVILVGLGRLTEADRQLDDVFHDEPTGYGYRYFLRALIRYDQDQLQQAAEDVAQGEANTWGRYGLDAYVQGLLALDAGDRETAIELLRLAEASLLRDYAPLLGRIQRDLARLDVSPVAVTPSVRIESTAIPTPVLTATVPPLAGVKVATPDGTMSVHAETGTGPLVLHGGDYPVFRFAPPVRVLGAVQKLTVWVLPAEADPAPDPTLQIYLWTPEGGWGMIDDVRWGENQARTPAHYVLPAGDVILAVRNWGDSTYSLANLAIRIETLKDDGTTGFYGWW